MKLLDVNIVMVFVFNFLIVILVCPDLLTAVYIRHTTNDMNNSRL
jgi:hypothetical protein